MANSFKNSYFYIGYIRRVFLSLLLCFSFGLTAELHSTLIENLEKSNEILDSLKISKKQKEDILNSIKALKENENELKEFEILKVYLEANGDEKFIAEIEKIFTELNDKESLEKLEKLGYKLKKDNLENIRRQNLENIRRQNNGN